MVSLEFFIDITLPAAL